MIVCSCRQISDKDFCTQKDLKKRLLENDIKCGSCVRNLAKTAKYIIKA